MEEEIRPIPKTCFNCSTQSANYYQKWRGNVVCHRCYMRLFREKKKNEQLAKESCQEQSMDGTGTYCLSGDDQNNNNNGNHQMDIPFPSDNSSEPNNQTEGASGNSNINNTRQIIKNKPKTNQATLGLMPPSNIDTSMFKKPVSEQEAQASMIKSLNAAHYYAGYYEAMKQFKK